MNRANTSSLDRLGLYIDHQNAYKAAREAFQAESLSPVGQFDPIKVAKLIAQQHPSYGGSQLRALEQVSVYSGVPSSNRNPVGNAAALSQFARWKTLANNQGVNLHIETRPLDYRTGAPREKGIDVKLALDILKAAYNKTVDVIVLFSGDPDLLPALEEATALGLACESAYWVNGRRQLPKRPCILWEHALDNADYRQVHDPYRYNRPRS